MEFQKKHEGRWNNRQFKKILVGKGFTQKHGVDYFDMYSLVVRIAFTRVFVAFALIYKLAIQQLDVKIYFFNVELDKGLYLQQL